MGFFSFRSAGRKGDEPGALSNSSNPDDTVEGLRRRARHRLIGATVLVALGVIGFPLLFDTQPRPVAVDIPIEIPDRNQGAPVATQPVRGESTARVDPPVSAQGSLDSREQIVAASAAGKPGAGDKAGSKPEPPQVAPKPEPQAASEPSSQPEPDNRGDLVKRPATDHAVEKPKEKAAEKPKDKATDKAAERAVVAATPTKPDESPALAVRASSREEARIARMEEAARARALLQGKSVKEAEAAAQARFIVQIGAFSEAARAQATRSKLERAGLKTYTQETRTANGTWIRVRVGPFATRAEADAAASKIKGLSLPASILGL